MRAMLATTDDGVLRRSIERLEALPIRPTVARQVFSVLTDDTLPTSSVADWSSTILLPPTAETDPGWALAWSRSAAAVDPAATLIEHRWWSSTSTSVGAVEALTRLWRHSVAVAFSARRFAREANDPDPDSVARAGLLHLVGLWALAAVAPDCLATWASADAEGRLSLEKRWFGTQVSAMGHRLAERWGCDPLMVDAAWLHADADGALNECASDPARLRFIQGGYAQARLTPWTLFPHPTRDFGPTDPSVRILTAEVQSRCGSPFIDPDASPREEWLTRDNLRLRRDLARSTAEQGSASRLVVALAESSPLEDPQTWADRAALAWCHEPGVASARVVWGAEPADRETTKPGLVSSGDVSSDRSPSATYPIGDPVQPVARLMLWSEEQRGVSAPSPAILDGWNGWARAVADRERVARTLELAVRGHRGRVARDESSKMRSSLASMAEFAAGAGHELNNPLAVIMGRAQLVLARTVDPDTSRSLRAIIAQAQRAHRILRDLMYVARPPESRPRACQPDEIVRASLRDLQHEADAQGVRLILDAREAGSKVWADPEPLRQVADILTRNALEASSTGGTIRFSTGGDARNLRWVVHDSGRGISSTEAAHLFDPFYCGRQAGRGLGLGLPRAARIIQQSGGDLRWHSTPGQGATFQVSLPFEEIPAPVAPGRADAEVEDQTK